MPYSDEKPVVTKPLPGIRLPMLAVLLLLAAVIIVYLVFLRDPAKLFGTPIPPNSYEEQMKGPKPKAPVLKAVPPPAAPVAAPTAAAPAQGQ
jgi:hypothetical protein